jgi:hypothetical protein
MTHNPTDSIRNNLLMRPIHQISSVPACNPLLNSELGFSVVGTASETVLANLSWPANSQPDIILAGI